MPYKSKPGTRKYGDSPLDANTNGGSSPYKMNGHTLPGIKQRSPLEHPHDTKVAHGSSGHNTKSGLSIAEGGEPNPDNPGFATWKKAQDEKKLVEASEENTSPVLQAIGGGAGEALTHWKKYKDAAKLGVRGALGTTVAAASLLYDFGKRSIERKKKGLSGFNIKKGQKNKPFTFNK